MPCCLHGRQGAGGASLFRGLKKNGFNCIANRCMAIWPMGFRGCMCPAWHDHASREVFLYRFGFWHVLLSLENMGGWQWHGRVFVTVCRGLCGLFRKRPGRPGTRKGGCLQSASPLIICPVAGFLSGYPDFLPLPFAL